MDNGSSPPGVDAGADGDWFFPFDQLGDQPIGGLPLALAGADEIDQREGLRAAAGEFQAWRAHAVGDDLGRFPASPGVEFGGGKEVDAARGRAAALDEIELALDGLGSGFLNGLRPLGQRARYTSEESQKAQQFPS